MKEEEREKDCLHEEYQGAWKVATSQGVVCLSNLHKQGDCRFAQPRRLTVNSMATALHPDAGAACLVAAAAAAATAAAAAAAAAASTRD